ncbi:hypothetical protein [Sinorhizobium meliloti]|nr:hypothetical protein [Sinorhizobium meliloti]
MDTQNWAEFAALFAREPTIRFFGEDGIALAEFVPSTNS